MSNERPYFCAADASGTTPVEMFKLEEHRHRLKIEAGQVDLKDEVRQVLADVPNWLPMASEVYNISSNLSDYLLVPVVSMPSDLPNRNGQAFPFTELTRFLPEIGVPAYRSWSGMPLFIEHANTDHTKACGIIFTSLLRPIKNSDGDLYKVVKLAGWDRTRNPIETNAILTKEINSWSMGAFARNYQCSICSSTLTSGGCEHVEHGKPHFRVYNNQNKQVVAGTPNSKLAYYNVIDPKGFELSLVKSPAYYSARETNYFTLDG